MSATQTLSERAAEASGWFETATRVEGDDDTRYVRVKDGAPE